MNPSQIDQILFLSPDLFTDSRRTPWAGNRIGQTLKKGIDPQYESRLIGESWEMSCDPQFPSQCVGMGKSLAALIQENPAPMLGQKYIDEFGLDLKLIIKLVNSRMPLSYQVHPGENYEKLAADESPKTESWLVLDADPGAGIYIGFNRKVTKQEVADRIKGGQGELKEILQFIPVKSGEYFEIAPGTPHAIGEGVTLLEPQFVNRGSGGKTFRLWDWDRRYDEAGDVDILGKSRELHLTESLDLIEPEVQWGEDFVQKIKKRPEESFMRQAKILTFPANSYYQMMIVEMDTDDSIGMLTQGGFAFVEAIAGSFSVDYGGSRQRAEIGQPVFLPAETDKVNFFGKGKLAIVIPTTTECSFL